MNKIGTCKAFHDLIRTGRSEMNVQQWLTNTDATRKSYNDRIFLNQKSTTVGLGDGIYICDEYTVSEASNDSE